ncbi:MAG: hypothetical protein R3E39_31625 [Anaerolineae bacterium]
MNDLINNLGLWLLLCCIVPFVVFIGLSVWVIIRSRAFLTADVPKLQERFAKLKAANPNLSQDQLVHKIIHQQSLRSGIIGAITSVGGLPLLPLGLAIDLFTSARIQTDTLHFIAMTYGTANAPRTVLALDQVLQARMGLPLELVITEGSGRLSRYLVRELLVVVGEKAFAKLIPGLGLIIGFAVNYLLTRALMTFAATLYARNAAQLTAG